jgi:glycosyl transferase family 1
MKVFLWHVHGSWTTAFVQGGHDYFVPLTPDRGPDGRGRAQTWDWPKSVHEVTPDEARDLDVDVVLLQRPCELLGLASQWLGGRVVGRDLPAVYLEHNTPPDPMCGSRHPIVERPDIPVVHVTHTNALYWDTGAAPTRVIEHGVVDPGYRYRGDLARIAVVINDAARRGRATGTDLLERFAPAGPVDLFGFDARRLGGIEGLTQAQLHDELACRRLYLHTSRWTSLGLSLIEAMHLGLPIVAVGATAVPDAVPPEAGVVSADIDHLVGATFALLHDHDRARAMGERARVVARERFGLDRFLTEWDACLEEVAA